MNSSPKYILWLVKEDDKMINKEDINAYYIDHKDDEATIENWASHIRQHYIDDELLNNSCIDTGKNKVEYLTDYVIPQKYDQNGPQIRACDVAEILISDLFEFVLNYKVPRGKQENRSGKCQSEHGSDVLAYKFKKRANYTADDELIVIEVKAGLSTDSYIPIEKALNDSHNADRDKQRYAHTLDYFRRKYRNKGDVKTANEIARFQNKTEIQYQLKFSQAAVISKELIEDEIILSDIEIRKDDAVFLIHGKNLMELTDKIFEQVVKC